MSALIVLSSELYSKKNVFFFFGFLGWGGIISFVTRNDSCLPKGVEAVSQVAGKDRPGARSLLQP